MAEGLESPHGSEFLIKTGLPSASTVNSSLKRLVVSGYMIQEKGKYHIDDPFFSRGIYWKRNK